MQRSHRRSTKVCTRCRKRKTKCDFKFPACTSCKVVNASCLGFDPVTRQAVPRSLVRSLEARVAELEAQVLPFRAGSQNASYLMSMKVAQATMSVGLPSSGTYLRSQISPALFFRPSCPPFAVVRERRQDSPSMQKSPPAVHEKLQVPKRHAKHSPGNVVNLSSVPFPAIQRMILNYVDIHLPQYPCVSQSMLEDIVEKTQHEELGDTSSLLLYGTPVAPGLGHFEYFVLLIVLAISAMTLTWKADDQARAASDTFYNSAIKHLQVFKDPGEIQALQISLLLAHYAHLCPESVDNWTCIANAARIVLSLGLYMECPEGLGKEEGLQRRRLFWVTYGMERSLSSNLRLPLSFPEETITVKFENSEKEPSVAYHHDRKSVANHIYRYRALETEVHRVLHLEESLSKFGCSTIEEWIQDISGRLKAWYGIAQEYEKYHMLEFKHVQFHHLVARIHRPTPRLRIRTHEDRRLVLSSSIVLVQDYLKQEQHRRLFYPWHGVHILFETCLISLDACWSFRDWQPMREEAENFLNFSIPQCLQLLTNIGQRWSEATACADTLSSLAQKVTTAFTNWNSTVYSLEEEAGITDEINRLLFADGLLTWNQTSQFDPFMNLGSSLQLFDTLPTSDLEFFEWNPEWDIMPADSI